MRLRIVLTCLLTFYKEVVTSSFDRQKDIAITLNMNLDSKMTCFYQPLESDMSLSIYVNPTNIVKLAIRLTSPSTEFSEWLEGQGNAIHMQHNVTENGDYEICVSAPYQTKILFHIYAYDPKVHMAEVERIIEASELDKNFTTTLTTLTQQLYKIFYSIKFYNQASVRDESLQRSNADFIKAYVVVFCISSILVAITEVALVRRMFRVDSSRIRI